MGIGVAAGWRTDDQATAGKMPLNDTQKIPRGGQAGRMSIQVVTELIAHRKRTGNGDVKDQEADFEPLQKS